MSDEITKQNAIPAEEAQKQVPQLSKDEMGKVVGGAGNAFVKFGDIDGESTSKDHKDWVTILKYDHATTSPTPQT